MGLSQAKRIARLIMPPDWVNAVAKENDIRGDRAQGTAESPDEKLVLHKFDGVEGISELFEYHVEALSKTIDLDFTKALGQKCCVSLQTYDDKVRYFNGVLTEAEWIGAHEEKYLYRLTLRPWLWLLSRRSNCRIYKNMSITDILKKIFREYSADVKYAITVDMGPEEYIAQYRETDLNFVNRLMDEYGMFTFFEHEESKHTLHVVDSPSGYQKLTFAGRRGAAQPRERAFHPPDAKDPSWVVRFAGSLADASNLRTQPGALIYRPLAGQDRREEEHLYHWRAGRQFRTAKFELRDYDYQKATKQLVADKESDSKVQPKLENYDYPGRWIEDRRGKYLVQVKLEAEQAADYRKFASGDAARLYPGGYFLLGGHPADDDEYLVVRASHAFTSEDFRSGGGGAEDEIYFGHYELHEKARPFRAPQVTPRPRIFGPQTAVVVTKDQKTSEEIDVDEQGRITVHFHWNRDDPNDHCSRAVRVGHMWSGKKWGWQMIPRVGQEVIVEFLEGDPDQPIVTGTVYNSANEYPYKMPEKKNISGWKSDSTKGHGGYNELYFDDTKGSEEVYFRAEKDRNSLIQNIETRKILNLETRDIGEKFKGGMDPSRTTTLHHGTDKLVVKDGHREQVIQNDWKTDLKMGNWLNTVDMGNWNNTVKMGNWTVKVNLGMVEIEAMQSITLKVGSSKIVVDQIGVTIEGTMIKVDGKAMTTVQAGAILTLKGGLTMIN